MTQLPEIFKDTRLSPEEAQARYGIKKDAYYTRLKTLNIKHNKDGNFYYLDASQIQRLDSLHYHLLNGGNLANYCEDISLLALSESNNINITNSKSADDKVEQSFQDYDYNLAAKLDRSAQTVAASILAEARNRLTANYLEDPSKMDQDLQDQVFLELSPTEIDRQWAGRHLEMAILQVLAPESPS